MLVLGPGAFADTTVGKLNAISEKLISGYIPKSGKTGIAVLPLSCDDKLSKLRVGFAVSEIISRKFIASDKFAVVEREAIDKVFAEQKLAASGAVSGDSPAAFGKLTGAGVILAGNVLKIGGHYQVNIRLIDTESSEVVGSGYAELDSAAFENEARPYLNLVPDEQALSIYFLYNFRNNANNVDEIKHGDSATMLYSDPPSFNLGMLGGGIRYFPSQKIFVDVSFGRNGKQQVGDSTTVYLYGNYTFMYSYYIDVLSLRGLLGYKTQIGDRFNLYTGLGVASYEITGEDRWGNSGYADVNYYTPTIQARVEYRLQSRVGVSIAAGYDFTAKVGTNKYDGGKTVRLGKLSFEPSVSLYF